MSAHRIEWDAEPIRYEFRASVGRPFRFRAQASISHKGHRDHGERFLTTDYTDEHGYFKKSSSTTPIIRVYPCNPGSHRSSLSNLCALCG